MRKRSCRSAHRALLGLTVLLAGCAAPAVERESERAQDAPHATLAALEQPLQIGARGWTSPWIEGPFEFDQLLPSWNVRQLNDAAFRVELQVRGAADSPWLDLGGWGSWPAETVSPTEFDAGRVAVDIFEGAHLFHAARLRFTTDGEVQLQSLSLCFTQSALLKSLDPAGKQRSAPTIEVPKRRQTDESPALASRICSPTSVSMLLAQLGAGAPTAQVATELYDAEHDIYGNWNRAVQGAFRLGVRGHLTRLSDWNEVADWLAQGTPVIASIGVQPGQLRGAPYAQTAGHLIVLCGLDGAGNAIVQDPAVPAGELGTRSYALEDLDQVWLRRGGFAYILGRLPGELRR